MLLYSFKSFDLNFIKHMWKKFKKLIHIFNSKLLIMRSDKIIKKNVLKNAIAQTFRVMKKNNDNHLIKHLMKSMSRRMTTCNLVHDDHITY